MKLAVVNQPLGNRGDEAAHRAFLRSLEKKLPDADIDVLFLNENDQNIKEIIVRSERVHYINLCGPEKAVIRCIKMSIQFENVEMARIHPLLRKYLKKIRGYDAVICAPGGICMGGFMNWKHVWQLYAAKHYQKRVFYWGRSIGPFSNGDREHALFQKISRQLIVGFEYMSLRDDISYRIAHEMTQQCCQVVDSAFLERPDAQIPESILEETRGKKYFVFVPNELTWHYKYRDIAQDKIDQFYLEILKKVNEVFPEHWIVMLPQTCGTQINDHDYFTRIKEKSGLKQIVVIDEHQNSDVQQMIMRHAAFAIGARYHSVIFAINNEIPFLSLSYEHKMCGMLTCLGLENRQIDIEHIFEDEEAYKFAVGSIRAMISDWPGVEKQYEKARKIAWDGFEEMCHRLTEPHQGSVL